MKALLYKDFVALWKHGKMYILMCAGFLVGYVFTQVEFLRIYPVIFMGLLPTTLIAYDEQDKWEKLVLTMPVSRAQIVSAKYLMGLILQGVTLAATVLAMILQDVLLGGYEGDLVTDLVMMVITAVAAPSLMLPPVFRVGSEKGRMAYTLMLCLVMLLGIGGVVVLSLLEGTLFGTDCMTVAIVAGAVLLYPASWLLSIRWYSRREF